MRGGCIFPYTWVWWGVKRRTCTFIYNSTFFPHTHFTRTRCVGCARDACPHFISFSVNQPHTCVVRCWWDIGRCALLLLHTRNPPTRGGVRRCVHLSLMSRTHLRECDVGGGLKDLPSTFITRGFGERGKCAPPPTPSKLLRTHVLARRVG